MATRSTGFDVSTIENEQTAALAGTLKWDETQTLTYFLAFSDVNANGVNDWNENGAREAMIAALAEWAKVADIEFAQVNSIAAANFVERIAPAGGNLGTHYLPGQNSGGPGLVSGVHSEGEFNPNVSSWNAAGLSQGGYAFLTLLHELGHGLGLLHPHDGAVFPGIGTLQGSGDADDYGDFDLNQGIYTVMTYNDGLAISGGSPSEGYGWQGTPMAFDIAAIQAMYGANTQTARGNNSYQLADQNGQGVYYEAIWDAAGQDEITYAGSKDAVIFLTAATLENSNIGGGVLSFVQGVHGGFTIANGVIIEDATTGAGDDLIAGNAVGNEIDSGAGDDIVFSFDGNDTIMGGDGADTLIGGDGSDFIQGGAGADIIMGDRGETSLLDETNIEYSGGIGAGDGMVASGLNSQNGSIEQAMVLNNVFSLTANANILNSTTVPHVTINGRGHGEIDVFAVTLNNPYATLTLDIDGASFDAFLGVTDALGNFLMFDRDSNTGEGASGSVSTLDSFLRFQPMAAGTYYIVVATESGSSYDDIALNATYTLHISVEDELDAGQYSAFLDELEAVAALNQPDEIAG